MFQKRYLAAAAMGLLLAGCSKSPSQAQLDETQRQLEETKKQLEEAKAKAAQTGEQAANLPPAEVTEQAKGQAPKAPRAAPLSPAAPVAPQRDIARADERPGARETKPTQAAPKVYTVPSGTSIAVRTIGRLSTKDATNGTPFEATLAEPLVVDGQTVAKRGATVTGVVTNSDPGGRVKGVASLSLALRSLVTADGEKVQLSTSAVTQDAKKSTKKDAIKVGIGSGIGAAIGAIAGGGKGAAIGAGAGAAGGTGVAMATRGDPAEIPSETVLTFRLSAPVSIQVK